MAPALSFPCTLLEGRLAGLAALAALLLAHLLEVLLLALLFLALLENLILGLQFALSGRRCAVFLYRLYQRKEHTEKKP